ncbi:MAG: ASCH domain-containing protein [Lachnospirales bacterium]
MIERFWNDFCTKNGYDFTYTEAFQFGADANFLGSLVVEGKKVATTSGLVFYELDGTKIPEANEYSIVLNSKNEPIAVIKTTKIEVMPFNEVSEEFALSEGEGDYEFWHKTHTDFFKQECASYNIPFKEDMLVVCENFIKVG